MSPTTRILTSLATAALLMLPATAAAKPPAALAPPGQSAISQYVEVVPNDMGSTPTHPGRAPTGALTSGQRRQLNSLGADGRTLADVVDATAQPAVPGSAETRADLRVGRSQRRGESSGTAIGGSGVPGGQLSGPGTRSTVSLLLSAAGGGGGGLGVLLPAIMAVAVVGLVVRAGRARRTGS
jgi:hypothetical protein